MDLFVQINFNILNKMLCKVNDLHLPFFHIILLTFFLNFFHENNFPQFQNLNYVHYLHLINFEISDMFTKVHLIYISKLLYFIQYLN